MKADPLGLWHLATGDGQVIATCEAHTKRLYSLAGLAMGLMCVLTPLSLHRVISEAFQVEWMAWVGSLVFSLILLNIYRLSLATVGGAVLPRRKEARRRPVVSLVLRILFLCGFAGFLSAPLCTLVYRECGEAYVEGRREQVRAELEQLAAQQESQWAQEDEVLMRAKLTAAADVGAGRTTAQAAVARRLSSVDRDRFFIGRIQHTYRSERLSYLITAVLMLLFISPMLLKRMAFHQPKHFAAMKELERELILEEYRLFLDAWRAVEMEEKLVMLRAERFRDPPFNTDPIERAKAESWDEFKTWFKGQ